MNNQINITIPLTDRQKRMVSNPARILHLGCGTKTGKTVGLAAWIIERMLNGEACAWVGPWFQRARAGYDTIKSLCQPLIDSGQIRTTDGVLRMRHVSGAGSLDVYSADNPQAVYGGNYDAVVIDEASRCPEEIYAAALTVISATNGKLRCAFNVELGSKNWAIRNLLRVQAMRPAERAASSEDFLTFPTGGDGLVDPALIAMLRSQMPEPLWRALYLAEIPASDTSLFRNLDKVFTGRELWGPEPGHRYTAGVDLARKTDFTAITIIDSDTGEVAAGDRFNEISWTLQYERIAALCKRFRCEKTHVDCTGLGDPASEELRKLGLDVEAFIFTQTSRRALLEELIVACDQGAITVPTGELWSFYRRELESFECQLDGQTVRYAVPSSMHDDCAMSLALATHGFRASTAGGELGLVSLLKKIASGARDLLTFKPRPQIAAAEENATDQAQQRPSRAPEWRPREREACPVCRSTLTTWISGNQLHCNQCSSDISRDGSVTTPPPTTCCENPMPKPVSGMIRCAQCGQQSWPQGATPLVAHGYSRRNFPKGAGRDTFSVSPRSVEGKWGT